MGCCPAGEGAALPLKDAERVVRPGCELMRQRSGPGVSRNAPDEEGEARRGCCGGDGNRLQAWRTWAEALRDDGGWKAGAWGSRDEAVAFRWEAAPCALCRRKTRSRCPEGEVRDGDSCYGGAASCSAAAAPLDCSHMPPAFRYPSEDQEEEGPLRVAEARAASIPTRNGVGGRRDDNPAREDGSFQGV